MEIVDMNCRAQMGLYDEERGGVESGHRRRLSDDDEEHDMDRWTEDTSAACRDCLSSRIGRACIAFLIVMFMYIIFLALSAVPPPANTLGEIADTKPRAGIDVKRAKEVLTDLCNGYDAGELTGDSCSRLCYNREWEVNDFYEGNKVVVVLKMGGQLAVFKSSNASLDSFPTPYHGLSQNDFSDKVLDLVNEHLMLGWPREFKKHLMENLWPTLLRTPGVEMTESDRRSLWALLQQPEFLLFRLLGLTRVTPKLIGSCGHFYETELLVAFRMKKFYMNLKGKILVHLMGTLKLLYEFLNEPLQWCDVRFENLGLSADYPKRFVLMDADMVYTESRLTTLMEGRPCETDEDCRIGDCTSRCMDTMTCSKRANTNLDVFCEKLVRKLYGSTWSKNNKYLVACNDPGQNATQRLNDLRLTWAWNLSDV